MEVVTRRHASDTLGVNKCRPDEVQYVMRRLALSMHGGVDTAQRARRLELATSNASCFGVSAAILMARLCLYRLHCRLFGNSLPPLAAPERGLAEQFVVQSLDYIASARAVTVRILGEAEFVYTVEQVLTSSAMELSFHAALEARWTSPDVVASLRMHGNTVEESTAVLDDLSAKRDTAQRADVAEHGLLGGLCRLFNIKISGNQKGFNFICTTWSI